MFAILIGGLLIAATVYFWIRNRNLPPGPWGLPIVGYLPWINAQHPHLTLTSLANKYGGIYSMQMGNIFAVILSDAKLIRQAFASDDYSGRAPLFLTHGLMKGNGIICAQGEKWKETRKFVSNAMRSLGMMKFGPARDKMEDDIMTGVSETLEKLRECNGNPVDSEHIIFQTLGNVVFHLIFGVKWPEDDSTWKLLQELQIEGTKLIGIAGPINFLPILRFLPKYKRSQKYLEDGIAFTYSIYQKIANEYQDEQNSDANKTAENVMALFLNEMEKRGGETTNFNMTQFKTLMGDIFGAGVDTTLATLRWFLLYISMHPKIQENIHQELDSIAAGRNLKLSDLGCCNYLEASICETQRIRPVTPLGIPHGTLKETTLKNYTIPKGTMVVPLQWAVHHDRSIYENPEVFDPTRFLSADGKFHKPDAFIPFQTGKRMCVGEEYARCLLFLFGGNILKEFRLRLVPGAVIDMSGVSGITLNPPDHEIEFMPRSP